MMNMDRYSIICQPQDNGTLEGGDGVNWTGHWIYLTKNMSYPYVKTFEVAFGAYVRHPDPTCTNNGFGAHYKNPWNGCMSRDQLTGVLAALIRQKERLALIRLGIHAMAWLCLFSYSNIKNGRDPKTANWKMSDPLFMDFWATYLRGFGLFSWLFWPVLCILDVQGLIQAALAHGDPDEDKISFAIRYLVSQEFVCTPVSWLAAQILNHDMLAWDIDRYWKGWRNNPEMAVLYRGAIMEAEKNR